MLICLLGIRIQLFQDNSVIARNLTQVSDQLSKHDHGFLRAGIRLLSAPWQLPAQVTDVASQFLDHSPSRSQILQLISQGKASRPHQTIILFLQFTVPSRSSRVLFMPSSTWPAILLKLELIFAWRLTAHVSKSRRLSVFKSAPSGSKEQGQIPLPQHLNLETSPTGGH